MFETGNKSGGLVWVIAGLGLAAYATVGVLLEDIPGVEQLVAWLEALSGWWVLLAAFIAMFLEGLYFIGSFFPGSSIVVLLAILAGSISWPFFALLVLTIYVSWVLAGVVNIWVAARYVRKQPPTPVVVEDRVLETWFPAFRANHEVAQVVSGADRWQVLRSSLRVKVFGGLVFVMHGAIVPLFIDITNTSNSQGFASLYVIAAIMLVVGGYQLRQATAEVVD